MAKFQANSKNNTANKNRALSLVSVVGLLAVLVGFLTGTTWLTVAGVVIIVAPFALLFGAFILLAILTVIVAVSEDEDKK